MSLKTGEPDAGRRRWSIARRLALLHITAVAVSYFVFGVIFYAKLLDQQEKSELRELEDEIVTVKNMLRDPNGRQLLTFEMRDQLYEPKNSRVYLRIVDSAGRPVIETPGMAALLPPANFHCSDTDCDRVLRQTRNDQAFLLKLAPLPAGLFGSGCSLQVATNVDEGVAFQKWLRWVFALFVGSGLLFAFLCAYLAARFGLKPVDEISRTAGGINPRELHIRIEESNLPDELLPLANSLNCMLARLEDSFQRLFHYSGNLAHELRTPINNLVVEAEIALCKERTPEEYQRVISSSLDEFGRLARIIDRLLFLARADVDQQDPTLEYLDVAGEIANVFDYYEDEAQVAGIALQSEGCGPLYADQTLFRRALGNLISNALSHTAQGGVIAVGVRVAGRFTEVTVTDDGCGIAPDHLPRIFDRFFRAPGSELRNAQGNGLGLAIVRTIVQLHRGTVTIASRPGSGTRVTLCFPVPDGAPPAG